MNAFIAGTDTGVGKTYVTAMLVRALRKASLTSVGMKPICCGDREDALALHAASGSAVDLETINPVWLQTAASPMTAAKIEGRPVPIEPIRTAFQNLRASHDSVLVEGVGGWYVPIAKDYLASDLARELNLPVIVVVGNRLGAINHTLLTVRAIEADGLRCQGIILNNLHGTVDVAAQTNRAVLEELLAVPILFEIEPGQTEIELARV